MQSPAFMTAGSDPEHYGQLRVFVMPRSNLPDGPSQVAFSKRNRSIETFILDGAHKSFGIRIRIGCLERSLHYSDPRRRQELANRRRPLSIPIADQDTMVDEEAVTGTGERAAWFRDSEGNLIGMGQPIP